MQQLHMDMVIWTYQVLAPDLNETFKKVLAPTTKVQSFSWVQQMQPNLHIHLKCIFQLNKKNKMLSS